jgi:transcriptional regulator with XRE-family HTH domain
MSSERIDFGEYLHELRTTNGYSQKKVSDKLGIDISLLSKIEHGERQVQGHMLKPIADLFKLNYKQIQIQFLNQKIEEQFGEEPYIIETIEAFLKQRKTGVFNNEQRIK